MQIDYGGDEAGGRILSWFKLQLKAIGTCLEAGLPEAALTILYSGVDSFGLLAAPSGVLDATRTTYKQWCDKYILTRLHSIEGTPITAIDLYAARCGVLHTSTPLSSLERDGAARQIWYQFKDKTGINMMAVTTQMPLRIDVQSLALAFKEGGIEFIKDLNNDPLSFKIADDRAQHFLRWGKVVR